MITASDTVYISGPMSGRPAFNCPLFHRVERRLLWLYNCEVLNPAKAPEGLTWQEYMRIDLELLRRATIILLLPGWEKSRGATIEKEFATMLGLPPVCAVAAGVVAV